jgi:hypothetical protein
MSFKNATIKIQAYDKQENVRLTHVNSSQATISPWQNELHTKIKPKNILRMGSNFTLEK